MLNLTLLASASAPKMLDGGLTVCDPLCGRGTTLNQALMYGYDAIGVELDGKDLEAYQLFLKTWLKRKRLKHTAELVPVRRAGKRAARRLDVTMAASKDDHKAGAVQKLTFLQADTTQLDGLLRAELRGRAGGRSAVRRRARQLRRRGRHLPPAAGPARTRGARVAEPAAARRRDRALLEPQGRQA